MKSNGKLKNAETLAKRFGVFVSVGDHSVDVENAKAAIAYRSEIQAVLNQPAPVTMSSFVGKHPEKAEFFTGKKGKELCRVKHCYAGKEYEWCGEVYQMNTTSPFWIQEG